MSQLTHPNATIHLRSHTTAILAALAALVAAGAVVLVIALAGNSAPTIASNTHPAASGPSESNVAAAVGTRAAQPPDESRIAASVASGAPKQQPAGPDESRIASSLSAR